MNLICGFFNSSASMSVKYLQMMARLVTNEMEWCEEKDNGIILGFILYFIIKMTRAIENLNKIGISILGNANICIEITAKFDKEK